MEEIEQTELEEDYEFLTEEDMVALGWSPYSGSSRSFSIWFLHLLVL